MDYYKIGQRIRKFRKAYHLSQEQLAEKVGISTTHISHIETGNSIPSLQVFVDILNVLECSADQLLCLEVEKARPQFDSWLKDIFSDCTEKERKLMIDAMLAIKSSMRRLKIEEGG